MTVGITLEQFKANVSQVARPNKFLLSIPSPPTGVSGFDFTDEMKYHVKSASLPGRTVGDISTLFWQGQNLKLAGDPTYDDYTVTFLNNVNFGVKNLMEQWLNLIANPITNEREEHGNYKAVIKLDQLDRSGNIIASYYLHGVYPKSFDAIEVSQETSDSLEEMVVNFSVDYWSDNATPGSGDGVGSI